MCCRGNVMEAEGAWYKYSLAERIFLITNYYKLDADYRAIYEAFTEQFPNSPVPTYPNILKLHKIPTYRPCGGRSPYCSEQPRSCIQKKLRFVLPKHTLKIRDSWENKHTCVQLDLSQCLLHRIMHKFGLRVS